MLTMDSQEKMFYTPSEACIYLGIERAAFNKWVNILNIGLRTLPGTVGAFLSIRDVQAIEEYSKSFQGNTRNGGAGMSHYDGEMP